MTCVKGLRRQVLWDLSAADAGHGSSAYNHLQAHYNISGCLMLHREQGEVMCADCSEHEIN